MPKLKNFKVNLSLPYIGGIEGTWEPDESEKSAAWEMYVELITRISLAKLGSDDGLLREALSSLYTLFDTTRKILREHGPSIAQTRGDGNLSFGHIAIAVLNGTLRPVLAKWHPILLDYEARRPKDCSALEYEKNWEKYNEFREVYNNVQKSLTEYAELLAEAAGVPSLLIVNYKVMTDS